MGSGFLAMIVSAGATVVDGSCAARFDELKKQTDEVSESGADLQKRCGGIPENLLGPWHPAGCDSGGGQPGEFRGGRTLIRCCGITGPGSRAVLLPLSAYCEDLDY